MKKVIASVLAGLVLGMTGTAVAGQSYYWEDHGSGYRCEGITSGVSCTAGRFKVGVTPSFVYVQETSTELTFGCYKRKSFTDCFSD